MPLTNLAFTVFQAPSEVSVAEYRVQPGCGEVCVRFFQDSRRAEQDSSVVRQNQVGRLLANRGGQTEDQRGTEEELELTPGGGRGGSCWGGQQHLHSIPNEKLAGQPSKDVTGWRWGSTESVGYRF